MSAHGTNHQPDGKMDRRTVTDFEPERRFEWSNSDHLHRRERLSPVLACVMSNSNDVVSDSRCTFSNAISS